MTKDSFYYPFERSFDRRVVKKVNNKGIWLVKGETPSIRMFS